MTEPNRAGFKTVECGRYGTTAVEIAAQIRGMIHRRELRPGERLPTERELAKLLGVSRPTLRDGISSLAAVGVLRSRSGTGTFVVEAEDSPSLDSGPLHMMASLHGFTPSEMLEARGALEMAVAELAAQRATAEQVAGMSEEIAEMYAAIGEPEQFLVHDIRFHQTVAVASGNRVLISLVNMVATAQFEVHKAGGLKESAGMHSHVYRAIRDRDPEAARNAMSDFLLLAQKAQESGELEEADGNGVGNFA